MTLDLMLHLHFHGDYQDFQGTGSMEEGHRTDERGLLDFGKRGFQEGFFPSGPDQKGSDIHSIKYRGGFRTRG